MNKNIFLWLDKKYKLSIFGIISFIITFFRLILAFFASYIILNSFVNNTLIVCLIILLIMFLDQFDGMIFRKSKMNLSNELTIIRRVFDSVCDRVCIFSICLSLLIDSYDFFNIFIVIIIKEILTSYPCIKSFFNKELLLPKTFSKISTIGIGVLVLVYVLNVGDSSLSNFYNTVIIVVSFMVILFGIFANIQYSKQKDTRTTFSHLRWFCFGKPDSRKV